MFYVSGHFATIENLTIKDAVVNSSASSGILLDCDHKGYRDTKLYDVSVINCHTVEGSVTAVDNAGSISCGLNGNLISVKIYMCTNSADVTGKNKVGGIASYNIGDVICCVNNGKVSTTPGSSVGYYTAPGGIVGSDFKSWSGQPSSDYPYDKIMYCINNGDVSGMCAGGIIGFNCSMYVTGCANYGNVEMDNTLKFQAGYTGYSSYGRIGGIAGSVYFGYGGVFGRIHNSLNRGKVYGDDSGGVPFLSAGIVGYIYCNGNYSSTANSPISYDAAIETGNYHTKNNSNSVTGGAIAAASGSQYSNYLVTNSFICERSAKPTKTSGTATNFLYSNNLEYAGSSSFIFPATSSSMNPDNKWTGTDLASVALTMETKGEYAHNPTFTITYNTYGAEFSSDSCIKYVYSKGTAYELPEIESICGFEGWYKDKAFTEKIETISSDENEDLTLYAKINHKLVNIVIKPTLTEQGYTLYSCSVCGCSYKDNYTPVREKPSKVTGLIFGARSADYV